MSGPRQRYIIWSAGSYLSICGWIHFKVFANLPSVNVIAIGSKMSIKESVPWRICCASSVWTMTLLIFMFWGLCSAAFQDGWVWRWKYLLKSFCTDRSYSITIFYLRGKGDVKNSSFGPMTGNSLLEILLVLYFEYLFFRLKSFHFWTYLLIHYGRAPNSDNIIWLTLEINEWLPGYLVQLWKPDRTFLKVLTSLIPCSP